MPNTATRRLIVAILYFCSAALFSINLGITNLLGLTTLESVIVITGVTAWTLAAIQTLALKVVDKIKDNETLPEVEAAPTSTIARSTHSSVNAALHVISSSCFIAADLARISTPTTSGILRLSGATLWLKSALTYGWLSRAHERAQEKQPDAIIRPCGRPPELHHAICEAEYLIAGILYTGAIWSDSTFYPLKATANVCWLLASLHESIRTLQACSKTSEQLDEAPSTPALGTP